MNLLTILTGAKNKILREKSVCIDAIEAWHLQLIKDMQETMLNRNGVGLAAPQIGHHIRLIVALLKVSPIQKEVVAFINPEITAKSSNLVEMEEGCLSLPEEWGQVRRPDWVEVTYLTPQGERKKIKEIGFNARILQHEIDHLDGILFVDHLAGKKTKTDKKSVMI